MNRFIENDCSAGYTQKCWVFLSSRIISTQGGSFTLMSSWKHSRTLVTWHPVCPFLHPPRWWPTCVWSRRGWTRVYLCSTKYHTWPTRFRMKLVSRVLSEAPPPPPPGPAFECCNKNEVKWKQWWNSHMCRTDIKPAHRIFFSTSVNLFSFFHPCFSSLCKREIQI